MTPDQIRRLGLIDMPPEAFREVMKIVNEEPQKTRSQAAIRMQRYRERRNSDVTRYATCDVTVTRNSDVTPSSSSPPPKGGREKRDSDELNLDVESSGSAVERLYDLYPRKKGKGAAIKAITSALRHASEAQIREALVAAIADWRRAGTEEQFIPHPATWFNQRRWEDEGFSMPEREETSEERQERERKDEADEERIRRCNAEQKSMEDRFMARAKWRMADPATRGMIPDPSPEEFLLYGGVVEG